MQDTRLQNFRLGMRRRIFASHKFKEQREVQDPMKLPALLFPLCLLVHHASAFAVVPHYAVVPSGTAHFSTTAPEKNVEKIIEEKLMDGKEEFSSDDDGILLDVIKNQLLGSSMIYTFASVRKFVRTHLDDYDWYRPELIITQRGAENPESYLRYPVTANAIAKFITNEKNMKILTEEISPDEFNVDEQDNFNVLKTLCRLSVIDADIVEFDDEFCKKELVYSLTVNRSDKRITVCFRGSVFGGKDWTTNINAFYKKIDAPDMLKDVKLKRRIKVHRGFHGYLLGETENGLSKFDEIVQQIQRQYKNPKYADYDLYVCGHSLGGALTSLLAFHLAGSGKLQKELKGRPVMAVSFASPQVGNRGYNDAFQRLEANGYLRHVRVSNQGDLVPVSPSGFGYTQTGVNLHVRGNKKMEAGYRNLKWSISQFGFSPLDNHSLNVHYKRLLNDENMKILKKFETFDELYDEYAGDFTN